MQQFFLDTNVVVYANDRRSRKKQDRALEVVTRLMRGRNGSLSLQVLQEYANVALSKLKQDSTVVMRQLRLLQSLRLIMPSPDMVLRQVEIRQVYGITFWDAGIVAAAEEARSDVLLSEDLNEHQFYAGVRVINPFGPDFNPSFLESSD